MPKTLRIRQWLTISTIAGSSFALAGNERQISWKPVKGAAYYEGKLRQGDRAITFWTRDTKFIFLGDGTVSIRAMTKNSQPLSERPVVDSGATTNETPPPAPPPPEANQMPPEGPAGADMGNATADGELANAVTDGESTEVEVVQEPDERLQDLESERALAFSPAPYRALALFLSIGRQNIDSIGGSHRFSGTAGIGGTTLSLMADLEREFSLPIRLQFAGHGHNFTTDYYTEEPQNDSDEKLTNSFPFIEVRASAGYKAYKIGPALSEIGLGIMSHSLPIMAIVDQTTGQSELAMTTARTAYASLVLEIESQRSGTTSLRALYGPTALASDVRGHVFQLEGSWRYPVIEQVFLHLGAGYNQLHAKFSLECPEGVAECRANGTSRSNSTVLLMGMGVNF